MNKHTVDYYLNLPYTIEVVRDNDSEYPGWVATVAELSGCMTQADTFEELGEMIDEAMHLWLEAALEDGIEIPEPRLEDDYSGKFVVRVPTSLHRTLAVQSEREGVSLNSYINVALASYTGREISRKSISLPIVHSWPGLSASAFQVMAAQGLLEEAQHADEALFGQWIGRCFSEIEKAQATNQPEFALGLLENLIANLSGQETVSPIIKAYVQMLNFQRQLLQSQIQSAKIMASVEGFRKQMDIFIGQINQPQQELNTQINMSYAQITTHSESQLSDQITESLFKDVWARKNTGMTK